MRIASTKSYDPVGIAAKTTAHCPGHLVANHLSKLTGKWLSQNMPLLVFLCSEAIAVEVRTLVRARINGQF